jgi:PRC-barrel domain.
MTKATNRTILGATLIAAGALLATVPASAFQLEAPVNGTETAALAYADPMQGRFGPPSGEKAVGSDHELNDAWLGMTVKASNGEVLGYVVDAVLDNEGEVTDIVVTSGPKSSVEIFIPAELATLAADGVTLALSKQDVANIRAASQAVLAAN